MQQIEATVCMFRIGLHGWQKRVNDLMAKGWILVSHPDKIIEHRWLGLREELYLKFLYEYFRDELNRPDKLDDIYVPTGFKRLKYQEEAVLSARKVLEEYGGLFLSDVVGLGKTYMAALLAQQLEGRSLVIAPPHLLDKHNRGSWPNVFGDFRVPHTDFESIGKLEDLLERDVTNGARAILIRGPCGGRRR